MKKTSSIKKPIILGNYSGHQWGNVVFMGGGCGLALTASDEKNAYKVIKKWKKDLTAEMEKGNDLTARHGTARHGTARLLVIGDLGVGGERGRVFKGNGIIGALSATDYKDPPKTLRTWTRSE